jgi:hypothetical protein
VLLTGSTLRQVRQHFQAFFELRHCLHHRRARQRLLTRLKPVADSLLVEASLGAMLRKQCRVACHDLLELAFERLGNPRVKLLAASSRVL